MTTDAKNLLRKFSTKSDVLKALKMVLDAGDDKDYYARLYAEIETFEDKDLAEKVIDYMNEINGTSYSTNIKVRAIISQIPKVTFEQFQSIILHKHETWGKDPTMKPYLRPATLFGSKNKFLTYLDDATNYWLQKQKEQ